MNNINRALATVETTTTLGLEREKWAVWVQISKGKLPTGTATRNMGLEARKEMAPKAENRRHRWLSVFSFLLVPLTI